MARSARAPAAAGEGVDLSLCAGRSALMLGRVYEAPRRPKPSRHDLTRAVPAWIVTSTALRRDGLTRAARIAGLQPVGPTEAATIGLRCDDDAETGAPVDVCASLDRVTVTITSDPGAAAWSALLALTHTLLGDIEGAEPGVGNPAHE